MFATEKEIDEAREKLIEVVGYDHDFKIEFCLSRCLFENGEVNYTKCWSVGCHVPIEKGCKCCGKSRVEYYTTVTDYTNDTPMKAVNAIIKKIKAGDYVP